MCGSRRVDDEYVGFRAACDIGGHRPEQSPGDRAQPDVADDQQVGGQGGVLGATFMTSDAGKVYLILRAALSGAGKGGG